MANTTPATLAQERKRIARPQTMMPCTSHVPDTAMGYRVTIEPAA